MPDIAPPRPRSAAAAHRLPAGAALHAVGTTFVDVLRLAADDGDGSRPIRCRWKVISTDMAPVQASCGARIEPDERLGDPARFDYIFVVGGLIEGGPGLSPEHSAFCAAARARVALGGLCTGVFALARLGLMDGYRCCVSWFHHQDFLAEFEKMRPVSGPDLCRGSRPAELFGRRQRRLRLAAFLVDRHIGAAAARKSLSILMIDGPMQGDRPQPGLPLELNARDPLVRRALLAMQQNLQAPLSRSRASPATLASAGAAGTPFQRRSWRAARRCLDPHPAGAGADAAGALRPHGDAHRRGNRFCDASHLIRVFREAEGITPDIWRQQASPPWKASRPPRPLGDSGPARDLRPPIRRQDALEDLAQIIGVVMGVLGLRGCPRPRSR